MEQAKVLEDALEAAIQEIMLPHQIDKSGLDQHCNIAIRDIQIALTKFRGEK